MDHNASNTITAPRPGRARRRALIATGVLIIMVVLATLALAMFPVGMFRAQLERRLSDRYGAPVHVGAVERDAIFSFSPTVSIRNLTIGQPAWAGRGDFVRVDRIRLRIPVFSAIIGRFRPDHLAVHGARVALVRDATGRSNWDPRKRDDRRTADTKSSRLAELTVSNTRFTLADAKRGLTLAGPLAVDAGGLRIDGQGQFRDMPATIKVRGGRVTGVDPDAAYPFAVDFVSPALHLSGTGTMDGTLDTHHFSAKLHARAPTLKNLDRMIEAGLFETQPIDLHAQIRHIDRDWFVDDLQAQMGRSQFTGKASVVKQDGRTKIDGRIHASRFDFDDLSSTRGLAEGAALQARIGPRIVPATRINLSKIKRTDGRIAFVADRLLARKGSVFRALRTNLTLDDRVLTASNIVATLQSGRMTGTVRVAHRSGLPKLTVDMRFDGASLEAIIGKPDIISGAVRGRILLSGRGNTVREALAHGDGKVAMVATRGSVKTVVADVLGQDLGRAIGHVIHQQSDRVPLRCMIADFRGRNGVFAARPIAIDTGNSVGRGTGHVILDGERVQLTLAGATRNGSALKIADPIRIGGTMSAPSVTVAGLGVAGAKPSAGSVLKVVTRSIGSALGLGPKRPKMAPLPDPLDCTSLTAAALR
ncbi:AsmA family protein [Sphingomonas endolithica]|uniref:AsmA family protein n=1 Tax=Sphingomonas endolithica TaxID=2972485 RepID=UPI0021AE4CB9|nr:AsmA family protein [Sphingomonas sp. ZFBP2030]